MSLEKPFLEYPDKDIIGMSLGKFLFPFSFSPPLPSDHITPVIDVTIHHNAINKNLSNDVTLSKRERRILCEIKTISFGTIFQYAIVDDFSFKEPHYYCVSKKKYKTFTKRFQS